MKGTEAGGSRSQARIVLDFDKLWQAGWKIVEDRPSSVGARVYFIYTNPAGKTVQSSKDVQRQLREQGNYKKFLSAEKDSAAQTEIKYSCFASRGSGQLGLK